MGMVVAGVALLVLAALGVDQWRRWVEREKEPNYVARIQVLAPKSPMALPQVKPLHARKEMKDMG